MDASNPIATAIRGRWAVAAIFFVNGFLIGSWAPQIPVFLTRLGISEFTLGLLILLFGAGAVSAMIWAGHLIPQHGSQTVTRCFGVSGCFGLLLVALAPNVCRSPRSPCSCSAARSARMDVVDERQRGHGREEARPRDHVVLARLLEPRRLRRRRRWAASPSRTAGISPHAALVTAVGARDHGAARCRRLVADPPARAGAQEILAAAQPDCLRHRRDGAALHEFRKARCSTGARSICARNSAPTSPPPASPSAFFAGAMALMRFLGDGVRNRFGAVDDVPRLEPDRGRRHAGRRGLVALAVAGDRRLRRLRARHRQHGADPLLGRRQPARRQPRRRA